MAAGTLRAYVCVEGPDGMAQFGPGDTVPEWAQKQITNPKAWVEPPEPPVAEPKRRGRPPKAASADAGNES